MASASDNDINIRVGITGVDEAKAGMQDLGQTATDTQLQVAKASDTATAALQKQLTSWTNNVDPAARAQAQLAKGQTVFNDAMAAGLIAGDQHAALLAKLEDKYGSGAAAVAAYGAAHDGAGGRIEGFREVLRGTTDAATGNITGLARAGAMLGNSYGVLLNPVTLALGAVAGGMFLAFQRAEELEGQSRTLDVALKGIGDSSRASSDELLKLSQSLEAAGASRGEAQGLVMQGARSGNLTPAGVGELSQIAMGMGAATGNSASAEMQKLLDMVQQGFPAIEKLDAEFGFLSKDELEAAQAMAEHGDKAGVLGLVIDALGKKFDTLRNQSLTPFQQSTHALGTAWDDLLDKLAKSPVISGGIGLLGDYLEHMAKLSSHDGMVQNSTGAWVVAPNGSDTSGYGPGAAAAAIPPASAGGPSTGPGGGSGGPIAGNGPLQTAHDIALKNLSDETSAEQRVAAAYAQSTAAGLRAQAMEQGRSETLRDNTLSENEYAAAILKRSEAMASAASAQAITRAKLGNQDASRVLDASAYGPGAEQRAAATNQARQATQPEFDAANAAGDAAAYNLAQQHLEQLQQELQLRDQINRQISSNEEDQQLERTLGEKQEELALMRQSPELRAQEIADLQTRNQLVEEGYEVGTKAFDDELAKRQQINEAIAQTDTQIKQVQKDQQQAKQTAQEFGSFALDAFKQLSSTTDTWHQKLTNIENDFAALIEKIFILGPLEQQLTALSGKLTGSGTPGGGIFGDLFGGGGSGGGGFWSSLFGGGGDAAASSGGFQMADIGADDLAGYAGAFAKGGVFEGGRQVRAYAKGGVVHPAVHADTYRYTDHARRLARSHSLMPAHKFASGGVVSTPTYFGMASGTGLMGEAGPEGILPLQRLPGGQLGVNAGGVGGGGSHYYIDARGSAPGVEDKIAGIIKSMGAMNASIERRAVTAVATARSQYPQLLTPRYGQ